MKLHNIIHDQFKKHYYRVHIMGEPPRLNTGIQPVDFWSATMTERFVDWLDVYPGYWRRLMADCPFRGHDFANNKFSNTDKGRASRLLFLGIIKLYPIKHLEGQDSDKLPVQFFTLPTVNDINYILVPPSVLLVESNPVVKTFNDQQQAARFLADLNMDQIRLNELSTTMSITITNSAPAKQIREAEVKVTGIQKPPTITPQIAIMAQALIDRQFFLLEQQPESKPPPRTGSEDLPIEYYKPKRATLGPHKEPGYVPPENPHSGLHNQEELAPDFAISAESFRTTRQVDMRNLSPEDRITREALKDQGWDDYKVEQVLKSGDDFTETSYQVGDRIYGFNTAGRARELNNSAYLLDEAGMEEVKSKYFKQGHWDKEGVKDYLAFPCFNAASQIDVMEVTKPTTGIQSTIGKATELLRYEGTDGYSTGTIGKIMGGGGTQATLDISALKLLPGK